MLGNESYISQFEPYKDGVITSRNTFQKYYTQGELKEFIEQALDENAIAIGPGIFYIFRDKQLEQAYLQNRFKRNYEWQHLTAPEPVDETKARLLFTQHQSLLESFWQRCLSLGRCPANDEFEQSDELKQVIGSHKKALRLATQWFDEDELQQAQAMRKEDMLIYFALGQFAKRKPYSRLPDELKRDIKAFFDSIKVIENQARELLFTIADTVVIEQACLSANESLPASRLTLENEQPHSLTLHKQYLPQLPPILRIYVGAGLQLYGELDGIQLIKIHITSGKLTLLGYENFDNDPTPALKERVKIKMAEQDVDFFDYLRPEHRSRLNDKQTYMTK